MSVHGIDTSENNGVIDWSKVRRDGKSFAWIKVNEGDYYDRQAIRANVADAKKAGLRIGGYDFLRPRSGRTGAQEFDLFHQRAKGIGLLNHGCLRPVLDVEATAFSGLGKAWRTRRYVRSWIDRCIAVTGKHPIVYTASWFWDDVMKGSATTARGCHLWVAGYLSDIKYVKTPRGFARPSFWQYTDQGKVAGVRSNVDQDVYLSTIHNLIRYHTL